MEKQTTKQKAENVMNYLKAISRLVNVDVVVDGEGVKATDRDILDAISYLDFQLLDELEFDQKALLVDAEKDKNIDALIGEAFEGAYALKQVKSILGLGDE